MYLSDKTWQHDSWILEFDAKYIGGTVHFGAIGATTNPKGNYNWSTYVSDTNGRLSCCISPNTYTEQTKTIIKYNDNVYHHIKIIASDGVVSIYYDDSLIMQKTVNWSKGTIHLVVGTWSYSSYKNYVKNVTVKPYTSV